MTRTHMHKDARRLLDAIAAGERPEHLRRLAVRATGRMADVSKAADLHDRFASMLRELDAVAGGDAVVRQHLEEIAIEMAQAPQQALH